MKWGISAMPSKMSLFNKELMLQIGRSTGWVSLVYFLGLLFAVPIRILMNYSDEYNRINLKVENLFLYDFEIQIVLLIAIPVLMSVFLFRFLHVKQATDLMHSLPLKRERIFHHYALCGLGLLILPVVIITIIVLSMHAVLDLSPYFDTKDIFYWAGVTLLIDLLLYMAGIFIAMMTGISAIQAVLSYVFLLFPAGMTLLVLYNVRIFLYGFPTDYYMSSKLENMSPITRAASLGSNGFHWMTAIIYAGLTILLYALSLFFYKKRKLETASEPIAFSKLRVIFKYGATFCTMLVGGMYFSEVPYSSIGWSIFGYAVGTIIGYFIAEMVLQKTWRVFTSLKGLGIYSVVIIIIVTFTHSLGIYEKSIPNQENLKSVLLTDNLYSDRIQKEMIGEYNVPTPMKEEENINAVRKLHQQIIADKKLNQNQTIDQIETAYLVYELKNGNKVIREYRVNRKLYEDFFKPIYESAEYKHNTFPIFKVKEKDVKTIAIHSSGPHGESTFITDSEDIKQAIDFLKKDMLADSYEDSLYYQDRGSMIEMNMGDHQGVNFSLSPTYTNFIKWLDEKDWLEESSMSEKDIDYILVAKNPSDKKIYPEVFNIEQEPGVLKITDKKQIKEALHQASARPSDYMAVIFESNYQETIFFDEEHVPDFIKDHFK
jgi:ABC-2 type transport system permease protein